MSDKKAKRGLGRGLSALMADLESVQTSVPEDGSEPAPKRSDMTLPIEKIVPNPDQPRRRFNEDALKELAESIREKGVIQPLIVRAGKKPGIYEIVAGERRWRASQIAQQHELPVIVRDFDDAEVLEIAIIENIQRADLTPIEEAMGYQQLMERFGHTQQKLSDALGKSRSHIANLMRLLQLPQSVQDMVTRGDLSAGHARALITSENPETLAAQVVKGGLSVRETEKLAAKPATASSPVAKDKPKGDKDADTRALEGDLSAAVGMAVSVEAKPGAENGQVVIRYKSFEELDEICRILSSA